MGLTMREKQAVTKQLALSYRRASKGKRGEILDWLVELTGYNRSYAARVLRQRAKPKVLGRLRDGDVEVILVEREVQGEPFLWAQTFLAQAQVEGEARLGR